MVISKKNNLSIGILIPAKNEEKTLPKCLKPIVQSGIRTNILVIDSSSTDNTPQIAQKFGVEVETIPQEEFNHGATREYGRKKLGTDIVVMLTADAFPLSEDTIEKLISPIIKQQAVVSYARQLPRKNADIFESVPREFNYPAESHIRSIKDIDQYGVYTFFCSNSCAAYLNSVLDEIGGFKTVLTNEDYFAAAQILNKGYKIAYVAEAEVEHSHTYSALEEFQRYFDTGYVRAEHRWINKLVGQAEGRGFQLFKITVAEILHENIFLLPKAILLFFVKWIGFRIGYFFYRMPASINKKLSAQKYYWDSRYYKDNRKSENII